MQPKNLKFREARLEFEYAYLVKLLKKTKAHTVQACELSGLGRPQLARMLERNKIIVYEIPFFGAVTPAGPEGWTVFRRRRAT